jgi:hypothetical protein
MTIRARVTQRGRSILVYLEDPSIPRSQVGPLGNYVRVDYDVTGRRLKHEAAVRGYGSGGHELVERAVALADRAAARLGIGPATPSWDEVPVATVDL